MTAAACLMLLSATHASLAQGICDTFGPGNSFDPNEALPIRGHKAGPPGGHAAAYFIDGWCAVGALRTLALALTHTGGPGSVEVSLHEGTASLIGEPFWSRTVSITAAPVPLQTNVPPTPYIHLRQFYWVIITPADGHTSANWHLNDQNLTGAVASRHWDSAAGAWGPWMFSDNAPVPALRIGGQWCYPDCDGSPTAPVVLTIDDFTCFIQEFAFGQSLPHHEQINHYANCDLSTLAPVLNIDDFTCFVNAWAYGCP